MRNILFLLCFLTVSFYSNAQVVKNSQEDETQRYRELLSTSTKTLVINLSSFSMNYIGNFKDELISWKGKVLNISIDENTRIITIIHNQLLDPKEMNDVLIKYHIVKDFIISYN